MERSPSHERPPEAPPCAAPDFSPARPRLRLPALACDAHAHILGPRHAFPYVPDRVYTPPDCLLPSYLHMLDQLGVERGVLVQPSVYGTDNRAMLQALAAAPERLRGVAVVRPDVSERELGLLDAAGVRGVRVNVVDVRDRRAGTLPMSALRGLAKRIRPLGWHMEFLLHVDEFPDLDELFEDFPVDIVLGHFGYAKAGDAIRSAGFAALLALMASGCCWVKFTGPYRICASPLPYPEATLLAHALAKAAPDRILWGTDWPHVMLKGQMPNDAALCDLLSDWLPDLHVRHGALVDNPARLYGF